MIKDYISFAFKTFAHRRMRSWLTMLGIFIGIAAIVSLVSLGQGLEKAIVSEFSGLGTNRLAVQSKSSGYGVPGLGAQNPITKSDLEVIEKVGGVKRVAGRWIKSGKVEAYNQVKYEAIISMPHRSEDRQLMFESLDISTDAGRMLESKDKHKVVVGWNLGNKPVFGRELEVGKKISLEDEKFEIVGILRKTNFPFGNSFLVMNEDSMRDLFDEPDKLNIILAEIHQGENMDIVRERIEKDLRRHRGVKKGKEDFEVQTPQELIKTLNQIIAVIQIFIIGIAAISLIVGGIGIMNTMYTAVLERTREIGVMKSIGAKNSDIALIFLFESGLIGLVGGIIGILIGVGFSKLVEIIVSQLFTTGLVKMYFPWYLILGTMAFAFLVGIISGTLPALQAARQNPVESLRYE